MVLRLWACLILLFSLLFCGCSPIEKVRFQDNDIIAKLYVYETGVLMLVEYENGYMFQPRYNNMSNIYYIFDVENDKPMTMKGYGYDGLYHQIYFHLHPNTKKYIGYFGTGDNRIYVID